MGKKKDQFHCFIEYKAYKVISVGVRSEHT